ncbi:hypothetical protein DA2_2091 [Desulfovibrio sp. A2]|nr:hypothetical protein DA2_2091 [Desulfovibrio sp. A2]
MHSAAALRRRTLFHSILSTGHPAIIISNFHRHQRLDRG